MAMNRIDLLNHRLPNEKFSDYRNRRLASQRLVKLHLKGRMIWEAQSATVIGLTALGVPALPNSDDVVAQRIPIRRKVKGTYLKAKHGLIGTDPRELPRSYRRIR